jgi:hypothetical protein
MRMITLLLPLGRSLALAMVLLVAACDGRVPTAAEGPLPWLKAGASSAVVSPEPGAFIAGDARNRRVTGVHDPLYARAVAFAYRGEVAAIAVVDNIGLNNPDVARIQRRAAALATSVDLAPERVLVSSTHTHSGPDVVGLWGEHELHSGRDDAYVAALIETTARQVALAIERLQPVAVEVASADVSLDWVENVTEPGLLDPRLTVVRLIAGDGGTVATLTNFACHPTVLDGVSTEVSADYPGGFYRAMADALPGEHLFLQGAIGGWVQPVKGDQSAELAFGYGANLAEAALDALARAEPVLTPMLEFRRQPFDIPLENPGFMSLLDAGVLRRPLHDGNVRTEVAYLAIGSLRMATHPGETSPTHSLITRRMLDSDHTMVLGLTQDALGYILTPEYFEPGTDLPSAAYLTATSVGREAAPRMLQALETLIQRKQP